MPREASIMRGAAPRRARAAILVLWTGYDQRSLGTNLQNFASIRMTLSDWIVGLFVSAVKRVGRPQDRLEVINCLPIRVCV
jgi:hypothetical protein